MSMKIRERDHDDQDRGPLLVAVACMMITLCTAAVISRVLARQKTKMKLGADDYLVFLAHCLLVGLAIEYFFLVHFGIGRHSETLKPKMFVAIGKIDLATRLTYGTTLTFAKASVLMLYLRLFSLRTRWFQIGWWANIIFVAGYYIAFILHNLTHCLPLNRLWSHQHPCDQGLFSGQLFGAFNAVIDLTILVLPIGMVWGLHLPTKPKVAVCGVFLLGLIGVTVSFIRVPSFKTVTKDFTYTAIDLMIWNMTETAVAIICACLPILRSLFSARPKKTMPRSYSISYPRSKAKSRNPGTEEDARPINPSQRTPPNDSTEVVQFSMGGCSEANHSMNEMGHFTKSPLNLDV